MEHSSAERLPDTEEEQTEIYERDTGSAQIHGQLFEYKFCALVYFWAINKGYKFKLASNVKGHGKFDDVFVEYLDENCRKKHIFVQLKSKLSHTITKQQLLAERGDFSLRTYYNSYIQFEKAFNCSDGVKLEGSIDESLFITYTNADVALEIKSTKVTNIGEEKFLMAGGSVLEFNEEEHKGIYKHLQDLPKHCEFLRRFRIFYCQAEEKKMDWPIKSELKKIMKLPESELDINYMCFIDIMKEWWQHKNFFLKDTNCRENDPLRKTSEKAKPTLVAKILDQRKTELDELSIKYKESAITHMKQLTEPHKAVLIFAPGSSTTLTAAKIHQMLSKTEHIILNLQQLIRYKTEVMLAWKSSFDVLVLESQTSTENFQDVADETYAILNEGSVEKKFVFISARGCNVQELSALRRTFSKKLTEEYDDWIFTDILNESTALLLEKKVTFQGTELQIKNLVKESDFRMLNGLDCDSMTLLLANGKPSIGTPTEKTLEYYIDRTLECSMNVKSCIQNESEIMVPFTEENLENLQGTNAYMKEKCNNSYNGQGIPHFSFSNEKEKGTKIQYRGKNTSEGLYIKDQEHLRGQNTDGFSNVRRGFQRKSTKIWRPSTLLDGEDRIILVTDDPGMGKSTLLTHLAKQTRELHPNIWIVRVNINNYTSILHGIKTNGFKEKVAIQLLAEAAQIKEKEGAQLEKQLFNYIYNSTGNMAVLIDGVDEVSPHYTKEVIQILRFLNKTEIRKIWVTSRNSVKDQLEQEFQCQSYSLTPFSVEDQTSFLVKFWNRKFSHIKADYLENLAQRVVELSSEHLSASEKTFMGIPLQSMLLAEMFEENLNQCSTSRTVELPEHINTVTLYDSYVRKKWEIYLSEKKLSDLTNVNALNDDKVLYDIFINNHKAAALIAILSAQHIEKLNEKNVLKQGADFLQKIDQGLEKTGIITDIIEGRPVFLHRTFAEYLVASWLCDNKLAGQVFMRDHLFESGFGVVRCMVDRILAGKCPLREAVLNSNTRHVAKLLKRKGFINEYHGGRTLLHVAVSCRNPEVIKILLEHGAHVNSVDTFLDLSPVQYAVRMNDWEVLSLMMEKRLEIREQVLNENNKSCTDATVSALRAAAKYGHTDLLRCLLDRGNCVNMVLPGGSGTLLHEAARGNRIHIVRTLVDLGANCDIQDANGKTALHVSAETGSLEVAKFIVERQEISSGEVEMKYILKRDRPNTKLNRLNVRDKDGNTSMHLAAAAGNTNTVCYLLHADSDVRSCNTRGEYPLTLAARYGRNDTVKLLLQRCPAVKYEEIMTSALTAAIVAGQVDMTKLLLRSGAPVSGGENEKPIHIASRMGHKEIVILLLKFCASLTSRTDSGNTALHLASEIGHLSLVKYLVELQTDGLYCLNNENETPLHLAARNGKDYIVTYFAESGFNINAASANGDTCLHVACENEHYTTVECLLKHGAEVNVMNSVGQTPLHIAASQGQTKIVELFFLHNANFSLRDKDGITALLAASINGHQDTVRFIVQHGGNIDDTDGKGNTIAHFAVNNENCDILNFLSKQVANLEVQNSDGDTPLLKAVREGRILVVKCLAAKLSDINTKGKDGLRPLDVAVVKGNMEITRLLLERNARSCKTGIHTVAAARFGFVDLLQHFVTMGDDINVKADNGESPLHVACKCGQVATVDYLCDHGAILDWQDNNSNTALHVAVCNGHLDATRILVEKCANLIISDPSGSTALHIAAKGGYLNIVQYLADSFAPIDMRNATKETALLVATAEGHEKIVRVLIEKGAGIGLREIEGKTALDIATEKGYGSIMQLLKDRAEGRILVRSNSYTVPQTESVGSNFKNMQKTVNAEVSMDKATQKNDSDTARIIKTRTEATLVILNHPCALNTAAENGDFEEVELLVKAGMALDYGDTFGRTALWGAASRGHKNITRFLLANGSCTNIPDCEGMTPIGIAAREGHWEVVDEFLDHGPTIRPEGTEYLRSQLYEASESGETEVVRIILKCGINVNTTNKYGHTPLHVAAKSGQTEIIRILLRSGANVNIADNRGKLPLIVAAEKGHVEIIQNLLSDEAYLDGFKTVSSTSLSGQEEVIREVSKSGASVVTHIENASTSLRVEVIKEEDQDVPTSLNFGGSVNITDEDGSTPLYVAALKGHVGAVRVLLKHGASVDSVNKNGSTPLKRAVSEGHVKVVRELLNHGANLDSADNNGWTPLNAAAQEGYAEIIRELLNNGANVDSANNDGCTPLNAATSNGHLEVVRELLKHGAKVESADKDGRTPLHSAGFNGHLEVVRELLKHGAKVESADKTGCTPLHTAVSNGHVEVVQELLKHGAKVKSAKNGVPLHLYTAASNGHVEVVRELLKHDAKVESGNETGCTPLNTAASNGHLEVVRELLKHGAKVESADKTGCTPLHTAVSNGHVEVVRELLKHGAKVEIAENDGWTPFYRAVSNGHVEVVQELLKHGANVRSANEDGCTPLYIAVSNDQVEVVRELLKQGAEVAIADKDGWTPLYKAVSNGYLEIVRELLKHGANVESACKAGWTPLYAAAFDGQLEFVRELLKHGAKVESANKNNTTPLLIAAFNGHVEVVQELLKHGAKMESANNNGWTPLNGATLYGRMEVVQELLKHGAKVESAHKNGQTPLHSAAINGHVEVVRQLLKHGAKLESALKDGWTPLHSAAINGHVEVVQELLKHGAKVESAHKNGQTPLHRAAINGHVEVVRQLLKHGAKLESALKDGWTTLHSAAFKGRVEVVQELLKHGAKVESAHKNGQTPLHSAALNGHVEVVQELLKHGAKVESAHKNGQTPLHSAAINGHVEVVRQLLKHGAKLESALKDGWTPLHSAAFKGCVEVVQELLKHGAKVESAHKNGQTPLHSAAINGHVEVVRQLLKHGAKLESALKDGWTPLHSAAFKGRVEVVQELLKHGAKVESAHKNGQTPLHSAAINGHVEVIQELLKHGAKLESAHKNGQTPLHSAAINSHVEVVQELLKHGAKVETARKNGQTPLHSAAINGHVEVVRQLLKHGAKLESALKNGWTPLHSAAFKGRVEVVRELLKHGAKVESANSFGWTPLKTAAERGHMDVVRELQKYSACV